MTQPGPLAVTPTDARKRSCTAIGEDRAPLVLFLSSSLLRSVFVTAAVYLLVFPF